MDADYASLERSRQLLQAAGLLTPQHGALNHALFSPPLGDTPGTNHATYGRNPDSGTGHGLAPPVSAGNTSVSALAQLQARGYYSHASSLSHGLQPHSGDVSHSLPASLLPPTHSATLYNPYLSLSQAPLPPSAAHNAYPPPPRHLPSPQPGAAARDAAAAAYAATGPAAVYQHLYQLHTEAMLQQTGHPSLYYPPLIAQHMGVAGLPGADDTMAYHHLLANSHHTALPLSPFSQYGLTHRESREPDLHRFDGIRRSSPSPSPSPAKRTKLEWSFPDLASTTGSREVRGFEFGNRMEPLTVATSPEMKVKAEKLSGNSNGKEADDRRRSQSSDNGSTTPKQPRAQCLPKSRRPSTSRERTARSSSKDNGDNTKAPQGSQSRLDSPGVPFRSDKLSIYSPSRPSQAPAHPHTGARERPNLDLTASALVKSEPPSPSRRAQSGHSGSLLTFAPVPQPQALNLSKSPSGFKEAVSPKSARKRSRRESESGKMTCSESRKDSSHSRRCSKSGEFDNDNKEATHLSMKGSVGCQLGVAARKEGGEPSVTPKVPGGGSFMQYSVSHTAPRSPTASPQSDGRRRVHAITFTPEVGLPNTTNPSASGSERAKAYDLDMASKESTTSGRVELSSSSDEGNAEVCVSETEDISVVDYNQPISEHTDRCADNMAAPTRADAQAVRPAPPSVIHSINPDVESIATITHDGDDMPGYIQSDWCRRESCHSVGDVDRTVGGANYPTDSRTRPLSPPASRTRPLSPPASRTRPLSPPASRTRPLSPPASRTRPLSPPASRTRPLTPPASRTRPLTPSFSRTRPLSMSPSDGSSPSPSRKTASRGILIDRPSHNSAAPDKGPCVCKSSSKTAHVSTDTDPTTAVCKQEVIGVGDDAFPIKMSPDESASDRSNDDDHEQQSSAGNVIPVGIAIARQRTAAGQKSRQQHGGTREPAAPTGDSSEPSREAALDRAEWRSSNSLEVTDGRKCAPHATGATIPPVLATNMIVAGGEPDGALPMRLQGVPLPWASKTSSGRYQSLNGGGTLEERGVHLPSTGGFRVMQEPGSGQLYLLPGENTDWLPPSASQSTGSLAPSSNPFPTLPQDHAGLPVSSILREANISPAPCTSGTYVKTTAPLVTRCSSGGGSRTSLQVPQVAKATPIVASASRLGVSPSPYNNANVTSSSGEGVGSRWNSPASAASAPNDNYSSLVSPHLCTSVTSANHSGQHILTASLLSSHAATLPHEAARGSTLWPVSSASVQTVTVSCSESPLPAHKPISPPSTTVDSHTSTSDLVEPSDAVTALWLSTRPCMVDSSTEMDLSLCCGLAKGIEPHRNTPPVLTKMCDVIQPAGKPTPVSERNVPPYDSDTVTKSDSGHDMETICDNEAREAVECLQLLCQSSMSSASPVTSSQGTSGLGLLCVIADFARSQRESPSFSTPLTKPLSVNTDLNLELPPENDMPSPDINENYNAPKSWIFEEEDFSATSPRYIKSLSQTESGDEPWFHAGGAFKWNSGEDDPAEVEMRMRMAELQRCYRQKQKELARLQPRRNSFNRDKRGPGRPKKRKSRNSSSVNSKSTDDTPQIDSDVRVDDIPDGLSNTDSNGTNNTTTSNMPASVNADVSTTEERPTNNEVKVKEKNHGNVQLPGAMFKPETKVKHGSSLGSTEQRCSIQTDSSLNKMKSEEGSKKSESLCLHVPSRTANDRRNSTSERSSSKSSSLHGNSSVDRLSCNPSGVHGNSERSSSKMSSIHGNSKSEHSSSKHCGIHGNTPSERSNSKPTGKFKSSNPPVKATLFRSKSSEANEDSSGSLQSDRLLSKVSLNFSSPQRSESTSPVSAVLKPKKKKPLSEGSSFSPEGQISNKKRKPGRPKKFDEMGITETIVAKKPKGFNFFGGFSSTQKHCSVRKQGRKMNGRSKSPGSKSPMSSPGGNGVIVKGSRKEASISLQDWNRRRSERIFLSEAASPPTSTLHSPSAASTVSLPSPGTLTHSKPSRPRALSLGQKTSNVIDLTHKVKSEKVRERSCLEEMSLQVKKKYSKSGGEGASHKARHGGGGDGASGLGSNEGHTKLPSLQDTPAVRVESDSEWDTESAAPSSSSGDDNLPLASFRDRTPTPPSPKSLRSCIIQSCKLEDGCRILFFQQGLFYEAEVKAIHPPDVYGVLIDGERGSRPHIMSREELLKAGVLDVNPSDRSILSEGTRVCAYWSQQFSCLYPGTIAKPTSMERKDLISVEFDDGDSGNIPLDFIRMLPQDFPLQDVESSPLILAAGRKRRAASEDGFHGDPGEWRASFTDTHSAYQAAARQKKKSPPTLLPAKKVSPDETKPAKCSKDTSSVSAPGAKKVLFHPEKSSSDVEKPITSDSFLTNSETLAPSSAGKGGKEGESRKEEVSSLTSSDSSSSDESSDSSSGSSSDSENQSTSSTSQTSQTSSSSSSSDEDEDAATSRRVADNGEGTSQSSDETYEPPSQKRASTTPAKKAQQQRRASEGAASSVKKRQRQASVDSTDVLPSRQLWCWVGNSTKRPGAKGRARREYYKSIQRGKELLRVGECAVFLSTGRPNLPFVGRIESLWEGWGGSMVVRVKWFYHPEETKGGKKLAHIKGALYQSPHEDENDVQTISHKCQVLSYAEYKSYCTRRSQQMRAKGLTPTPHPPDVYYLAGTYEPTIGMITFEDDVKLIS